MENIRRAMIAEETYLNARMSFKEAILDLSPYGYADLASYFADKRDYQLKHCGITVYETTMNDITNRVERAITAQHPSIWIPQANSIYCWHGDEELNIDACERLNVDIYDMNYIGGTIVGGAEDLSIELIVPDYIDINTDIFLQKIKAILEQKVSNVVIDGNDILVNGDKVLGTMQRRSNGMYVFACQLSFADRSEIIRQICTKQSAKTPSYITGITKEEVKGKVIEWLQ